MSIKRTASTCLVALALGACASSSPKPAGVLVVEDESRVRGCRPLGTVSDDSLDDLQKKAAKLGGNVVFVVSSGIHASGEAYRCSQPGEQR